MTGQTKSGLNPSMNSKKLKTVRSPGLGLQGHQGTAYAHYMLEFSLVNEKVVSLRLKGGARLFWLMGKKAG